MLGAIRAFFVPFFKEVMGSGKPDQGDHRGNWR